jgi:NDP-sugar pyrophosphorylase family protein
VVPAAGYARRLQPLDGSKEVLPVSGSPVMDHVIERMRIAGCDDVVVVTRSEKHDVRERAEQLGASIVLATPTTVSASLLAGLRNTSDATTVVIGFPDTVWYPVDGYVQLIEALHPPYAVALGLFAEAELDRSDVVTTHPSGNDVASVEVKPARPPGELIWGCAAARTDALDGLDSVPEPGQHWDRLARRRLVVGVRLPGPYVDIGTRRSLEAVRSASVAEP